MFDLIQEPIDAFADQRQTAFRAWEAVIGLQIGVIKGEITRPCNLCASNGEFQVLKGQSVQFARNIGLLKRGGLFRVHYVKEQLCRACHSDLEGYWVVGQDALRVCHHPKHVVEAKVRKGDPCRKRSRFFGLSQRHFKAHTVLFRGDIERQRNLPTHGLEFQTR